MDTSKFLHEIAKRLPRDGETEISVKEYGIEVYIDPSRCFTIRKSGGITFPEWSVHDSELNEYYFTAVNTVNMVREYMTAMEQAPPLTAIDFDMPYKKLAEFHGVVLGGVEQSNGEYHFTTWDYKDNALYHGHYYGMEYEKAKEDFAVRSGLVNVDCLFNHEQLVEIYRCAEDFLRAQNDLIGKPDHILTEVCRKIEKTVPELDERVHEANCREIERNMQEGMSGNV